MRYQTALSPSIYRYIPHMLKSAYVYDLCYPAHCHTHCFQDTYKAALAKQNDFEKIKMEFTEMSKAKRALEENISDLTTEQRHGVAKVHGHPYLCAHGNSVHVTHTHHIRHTLPAMS